MSDSLYLAFATRAARWWLINPPRPAAHCPRLPRRPKLLFTYCTVCRLAPANTGDPDTYCTVCRSIHERF